MINMNGAAYVSLIAIFIGILIGDGFTWDTLIFIFKAAGYVILAIIAIIIFIVIKIIDIADESRKNNNKQN